MATINTLHKSITEMTRMEAFEFIKAIRLRRAIPVVLPKTKTKAKKRVPKTTNPLTLAKSLSAKDQAELKRILLESMK